MNRRKFLTQTACVVGTAAGQSSFASALQTVSGVQEVLVTLDPAQTLGVVSSEFMGLGYEISSVARPGLFSARNTDYVALVRTLGARGVIRIGGNTSDYASYSPNGQPLSSPEGKAGSIVNAEVIRDLGTFLEATGWDLIWGLNLGNGSQDNAIEEAKAVTAAAKEHLLAFEIGNEPDLFPNREAHRQSGYGYEDYLGEYRKWRDTLRKAIPNVPLAGPDVADATDWVTRFAMDEGKDIKLLTHHYYREGQNPTSSIDKLLHPDPKLAPTLAKLRAASESSGVPYRICETNSFSGGGRPGVSDTFASALWVLDFMFTLASAGCSGVNMETGVNHRGFISSYSPIGDDEHGHYSATPEYYGMLAFAQAGKGRFIKADIKAESQNVKAYATQQEKGSVVLALINKEPLSDAMVRIVGVPNLNRATVLRLPGPSIDSKTGVSLGGATVTESGMWKPSHPQDASVSAGRINLKLPAASAAIVTLHI